jgi:hypothetical protein
LGSDAIGQNKQALRSGFVGQIGGRDSAGNARSNRTPPQSRATLMASATK